MGLRERHECHGRDECHERKAARPHRPLAPATSEPDKDTLVKDRMGVIVLPRAALESSGPPAQIGDLVVVDISGASRAVIVFQLAVDRAVVVDVT